MLLDAISHCACTDIIIYLQHDIYFRSYSEGRRIEADNYQVNEGNRQKELSLDASFILRHIMYSFNLPLEAVISLWACFYALIMRRPIPVDYFSSKKAVWSNIFRLKFIDDYIADNDFLKFIQSPTVHGFRRYFYFSSDESEHHDRKRHVLVVSTNDSDNGKVNPSFRHLSSSVSGGNADKNVKLITEHFGIVGAAYLGGGCNDNAGDAQKEIRDTHKKIMDEVRAHPDPEVRDLAVVNGVDVWPIVFGDPFHICNLAMSHTSIHSFGDLLQGDHSQAHHLQVIQSIHSLRSDDKPLSQAIMDEVMEGSGCAIRLKSARERRQRWLVNQRSAKNVLENLKCLTVDGVPSLVQWGLSWANWSRSDWKRRVGGEIATWLMMPEIILGLQFEAELGDYFETTYYWHNRPGPFNSRAGFRMMEVHELYFNFILPWWNEVVDNPESKLEKTMKYIEENFEGDERAQRRAQIMRGLNAGREEVIKMTRKSFLEGPVAFLILCDSTSGPSFLRALLAVIDGQASPTTNFINDVDSPSERPEEEQLWYNQLSKEPEKTLHWWQQFCLDWPCLSDDLQRRSRETGPPRESANESPLVSFKAACPVLYECLESVFGLMMSNSRLCEQIHGMLRHALRDGTGMDEVDDRQSYSVGPNYNMRQERREMVSSGESSSGGVGARVASSSKKRKTKPNKHSDTKDQVRVLSKQLVERAARFKTAATATILQHVPTVGEIHRGGRRKQDREHITKKVDSEKAKRATLTREVLTIDKVRENAKNLKLSNDAVMLVDDATIERRNKTKEMTFQNFWDKLRPNAQYKEMFRIATVSFGPHLFNIVPKPKVLPLRSKTAVLKQVVGPYRTKVKYSCEQIYMYLYGKGPTAVPARERILHLMDIYDLFGFLRPVPEAFGEERADYVHPATRAVISSFKKIDPHFTEDVDGVIDLTDPGDVSDAIGVALAMEEDG